MGSNTFLKLYSKFKTFLQIFERMKSEQISLKIEVATNIYNSIFFSKLLLSISEFIYQ